MEHSSVLVFGPGSGTAIGVGIGGIGGGIADAKRTRAGAELSLPIRPYEHESRSYDPAGDANGPLQSVNT